MIPPRRGTQPAAEAHADLRTDDALLRDFVETSRDALVYRVPRTGRTQRARARVVRQVFENACVWRLCNPALARLYRLPPERDFNAQNVRFAFPRNVETRPSCAP